MKKFLLLFVPFVCLVLSGCNSDEPEVGNSTGYLIVHFQQEGDEDVDFSEYGFAIIPKQGFIPSAQVKDITWPVQVFVGTYTIAAASPYISETETSVTYYYGEAKNVKISKGETTEITLTLTLKQDNLN